MADSATDDETQESLYRVLYEEDEGQQQDNYTAFSEDDLSSEPPQPSAYQTFSMLSMSSLEILTSVR